MKLTLEDHDERLFGKILARQAEDIPDTPFLVTDRSSISFGETEAETNRLAAGLAALGIGPGDRVVLYLSNRPEMVLLALAINKLSAIWVPINTDYRGAWLADAIVGVGDGAVVELTAELLEGRVELAILGAASSGHRAPPASPRA